MLGNFKEITGQVVTNPLAHNAMMKVLVGPQEGWDTHVMRVFELAPSGFTPKHAHDWPHINVILEGQGTLFLNGIENNVEAGGYAFVPGGELHQFKNVGDTPFKFICIVPIEGHK
ncbi:MAG: cupin [Erysipelotrichaceae bacterium]|nr:MAG: hypothetical protein FD179_197 [Erysipelotrichaceae bacterium]TXT17662.1 MAG: cupin [Erysipelotrichaceae bacterium]